jgi:Concanavalin A-like lectin/glucanases superfamily
LEFLLGPNAGGGGGGTMQLYINGPFATTSALSGNVSNNNALENKIASLLSGFGNLAGRLYRLSIYNRALSAADALALYNAG